MEMKIDRSLIRKQRLAKSWSQEMLAEKSGLHLRTVQRVETNGVASLHTRRAIATALGIEPHELDAADGEDAPETITARQIRPSAAHTHVRTDGPIAGRRHPAPSAARADNRRGLMLVGFNFCVVTLTLGFVILDQIYARLLVGQSSSADAGLIFSEVADFLLQFGFLTLPITLAALVVAWPYRWARLLLIASIAFGWVMEVIVAAGINVFLPDLWIALDESHAGMLVRLAGHASAALFAFWAWIEFSRPQPRHLQSA